MKDKIYSILQKFNQWQKTRISKSNFIIILAAFVGLLGGIAASVLKKLTHFVANYLQNDFHWQYKFYLYLAFPLIGLTLTVLYIRTFIRKHKFEHGVTSILFNISKNGSRLDFHNIYSQIISSALTVGWGGSAGLEAPAVASGASIGSVIGRFFNLNYREVTLLLACGGAAGISGAFNSPIAGMIFAIEVLLPEFSVPAFIPLLIASAVASIISNLLYNQPLFVLVTSDWNVGSFWFYIVLGILLGAYTIFYSRLNRSIIQAFQRIKNAYYKVWIGGIALGIMIALMPALYGEGYIAIQQLLDGNYHLLLKNSLFSDYQNVTWALLLFALITMVGKTFASIVTLSCGGNGGMFGPSVVVGGLFGFVFAFTINTLGIADLNVTNFIIAGMAGSISGMMHAPLTGIFLSAEITGGYVLIVPLMIVAAISYFINKGVLKHSIYTKSLALQGSLLSQENKDHRIIRKLKLKYLIETDFVTLNENDTPKSRSRDIVHTTRNTFPVVDQEGILTGIMSSDQLLMYFVNSDSENINRPIKELAQAPEKVISVDTNMFDVMQIMESKDLRIIPVVCKDGKYLGFVTRVAIFNKYRSLLMRDGEFML